MPRVATLALASAHPLPSYEPWFSHVFKAKGTSRVGLVVAPGQVSFCIAAELLAKSSRQGNPGFFLVEVTPCW